MQPTVILVRPDEHANTEFVELRFIVTQPDHPTDGCDAEFKLTDRNLHEFQGAILSLVLGYSPHLIKSGNRMFWLPSEKIPTDLILHEKLARYLVFTSLIAVSITLALSLVLSGSPVLLALTNIGYEIALCLCLLGYFGIFIRIQAYRPGDLDPGWPLAPLLEVATRRPMVLLFVSILLLLICMGARLAQVMAW